MKIAILYTITLMLFLTLDYFGLKYIVKPAFTKEIPDLLLDSPRLGPALVFYAFYVACLIWFVSFPSMQDDQPLYQLFGSAALLGAMAYGTYEFTNWATLRGWTGEMVATDFVWGVLLTGLSATLGVVVTRAIN